MLLYCLFKYSFFTIENIFLTVIMPKFSAFSSCMLIWYLVSHSVYDPPVLSPRQEAPQPFFETCDVIVDQTPMDFSLFGLLLLTHQTNSVLTSKDIHTLDLKLWWLKNSKNYCLEKVCSRVRLEGLQLLSNTVSWLVKGFFSLKPGLLKKSLALIYNCCYLLLRRCQGHLLRVDNYS